MPKKKSSLKKTLNKNKTMSKREYVYRALLAIVKLDVVLKPVKKGISRLKQRLTRSSAKENRASLRRAIQQTTPRRRYARPVSSRRSGKRTKVSVRE